MLYTVCGKRQESEISEWQNNIDFARQLKNWNCNWHCEKAFAGTYSNIRHHQLLGGQHCVSKSECCGLKSHYSQIQDAVPVQYCIVGGCCITSSTAKLRPCLFFPVVPKDRGVLLCHGSIGIPQTKSSKQFNYPLFMESCCLTTMFPTVNI